jgi:hypothetical protein
MVYQYQISTTRISKLLIYINYIKIMIEIKKILDSYIYI